MAGPRDYDDEDDRPRRGRDDDRYDDRYDDRPRRPARRDDRDDDRPRRQARRDDWDDDRPRRPAAKGVSVLGIISLVGGILSLFLSFIPCIGSLSLVGGFFGFLLGAIGVRVARWTNQGKGLPFAGMAVNALSMFIAIVWLVVMANATSKATLEEVATAEAVKITAAQLCRDYESNLVKADETYKGRVLEVTGQVKLVTKERAGRLTVELGRRDDTVDCDFGSATKDELAGIEVGQTVTIRGKCKGVDRRSNYVVLESCKMVKDAPAAPAVKVEAAALLKEFGADGVVANKTYKGKVLEVTGKVTEANDTNKRELVIVFRPEKGPPLECRLTPEASKTAGAIIPGQTVTVRGECAGLQNDDGDEVILMENATLVK